MIRVGAWESERVTAMTMQTPRGVNPQSYLPHDGSEYKGHAPADAASVDVAINNAMTTIRNILTEERRTTSRRSLPDLAPGVLPQHLVARPKRSAKKTRKPAFKGAITAKLARPARSNDRIAQITSLRPKLRHAFWMVAFALVVLWPKAVLVGLIASFCLLVLGTVVFGGAWIKGLCDMVIAVLPASWSVRANWPPLTLRRKPEPDPFESMPDPFDRISPEAY